MKRPIPRPLLRWHGGKFVLAPWIVSHFPEHKTYVEPYGGAGSVLLYKSRCYVEIWNDLSDDLYNLFLVMRDGYGDLVEALRLTPFSRREFEVAHHHHPNPVERARRLVVRSYMGFGSDSASNMNRATGFRANSNRSNTTPAHDWVNYEVHLHRIADRLRGVVIEHRPALEVMRSHNVEGALHYLDPPYVHVTRKRVGAYALEMTDQDHIDMLGVAKELKGSVVISGYENELYERELKGWRKETRNAHANGHRPRREVLWIK